MAGILKVDKYQDFNGNDIMTSDGAGNITINAAALKMTPAFSAYLSSSQTVTNNVYTKIIFNSEIVDTNSAYDTSTGRFTVLSGQGGKYMVYHNILADASTSFSYAFTKTYKNGSDAAVNYNHNTIQPEAGVGYQFNVNSSVIWDLSAGDYLEVYLRFVGSGTLIANATYGCVFGAYKIIGA